MGLPVTYFNLGQKIKKIKFKMKIELCFLNFVLDSNLS